MAEDLIYLLCVTLHLQIETSRSSYLLLYRFHSDVRKLQSGGRFRHFNTVITISSSGEPSASADFQIRGVNSINAGTTPLFILDGIAITADVFSAINPNDIESVSVFAKYSAYNLNSKRYRPGNEYYRKHNS